MGKTRVREIVRDPLAPIAAMAVAALLALGTGAEAGDVDDSWQRASAEEGRVVVSAVGKVYTPRLVVANGPPARGSSAAPEVDAPACTTAAAGFGYRVALAPSEAAGT